MVSPSKRKYDLKRYKETKKAGLCHHCRKVKPKKGKDGKIRILCSKCRIRKKSYRKIKWKVQHAE